MEDSKTARKRARDEPGEGADSAEVKRLREDLLDSLDDDADICTASQDLDSFMRSFQEEIGAAGDAAAGVEEAVDLTSDCGESRPDLGYLLEASDDELGIPPTTSSPVGTAAELDRVESCSSDLGGEFWEIPGYDAFGFGFGFGETESNYGGGNGEYVALDGLFDHSDLGFGSGEFGYRSETLPAQ